MSIVLWFQYLAMCLYLAQCQAPCSYKFAQLYHQVLVHNIPTQHSIAYSAWFFLLMFLEPWVEMQKQHEPSPRGSGESARGRAQLDKHISHLRLCNVCYHPLAVESHMTKQTPKSRGGRTLCWPWSHGIHMDVWCNYGGMKYWRP